MKPMFLLLSVMLFFCMASFSQTTLKNVGRPDTAKKFNQRPAPDPSQVGRSRYIRMSDPRKDSIATANAQAEQKKSEAAANKLKPKQKVKSKKKST